MGRPEAYKHAMRMIAAHFSPRTGKGQRAQSMDSDHSSSLPFVKRYLRATQVILEVKLATQGVQRVRRAAVMLGRNCFCSFQTALTALRSTSYSSTDRKQKQLFFFSLSLRCIRLSSPPPKKKKKGFPCIILYKALELPHTLPALRLIWFHFFCHIKHNFLRNESSTVYVPCELHKFLVFTPPNSTPPRGKNIK